MVGSGSQIRCDSFLKPDRELIEDLLPSSQGHRPFLRNLLRGQVKESEECMVIRKDTAILGYFPQLPLKALIGACVFAAQAPHHMGLVVYIRHLISGVN